MIPFNNKKNQDDTQTKKLMTIMTEFSPFLGEDRTPYVGLPEDNTQVFAVNSTITRQKIVDKYFQAHDSLPDLKNVNSVIAHLAYKATKGPVHKVFSRVARAGDCLFIDLGHNEKTYVKVSSESWEVMDSAPVKFMRPHSMLPMRFPSYTPSIEGLRDLLNIGSDRDFNLLLSFVISALFFGKTYPILILQGPQGSGKSTITEILKKLIDPGTPTLRALPSKEEDIFIACRNSHLICFDNLSGINNKIADCLCKIATGCGMSGRTLYTNGDEFTIEVSRPMIINGIDDLTTRADLADRSVVLTLPKITDRQRGTSSQITEKIEEMIPNFMGAIFDALVLAIRDRNSIVFDELPRMAEFAITASAGSQAFGFEPHQTMSNILNNRKEIQMDTIDSNFTGRAVRQFMMNHVFWKGTASELLRDLDSILASENLNFSAKTPNVLARELNRLQPAFKSEGIEVSFERNKDRRQIILSKINHQVLDQKQFLP